MVAIDMNVEHLCGLDSTASFSKWYGSSHLKKSIGSDRKHNVSNIKFLKQDNRVH